MRAGGGKQKGAQFERDVCVMLSRWITNNEREDVFWRSAMSGGRATVGHKSGKSHAAQAGDISCIHPSGHSFISTFAPECKFYANLDYQGLLTGKGKLLTFWDEIQKQAGRYKKRPLMVVRQNRMQPMVCLDIEGRRLLGLMYKNMLLISVRHNLHIIEASKFFKITKPFV